MLWFAAAGISLALCVIGVLMAFFACHPGIAGVLLVAWFASSDGYAHGVDISPGTFAIAYGAGFLVASAAFLALGTAIGRVSQDGWRAGTPRWTGSAAITAARMLSRA